MSTNTAEWHKKKEEALFGGGKDRIGVQHDKGKKTARERISLLLDPNSFEEIDQLATSSFVSPSFHTDGVVAGFGTVNKQRVALFSQDFTIRGGSLGNQQAKKICKIIY